MSSVNGNDIANPFVTCRVSLYKSACSSCTKYSMILMSCVESRIINLETMQEDRSFMLLKAARIKVSN